jgi:hypothetical protein
MQTEIRGILTQNEKLVQVPRFNEREVKDCSGKAVVYVCEMVLSTEIGTVLLDYGITPPDPRGMAFRVPALTVNCKMTPEVFIKILREPSLAVELNNKLYTVCRNGLICRMRVSKINEIKDPDIAPIVDLLISESLPENLMERIGDTWIPEKVDKMPLINDFLAQKDPAAFESSFNWYSAFVLRQNLPLDIEDTRELLLVRESDKYESDTVDAERQKKAEEKVAAIRTYFQRFPMLRRLDKIRVRPNTTTRTAVQLVDALM